SDLPGDENQFGSIDIAATTAGNEVFDSEDRLGETPPYDGHTIGFNDLINVLNNYGTTNAQGYAWPDTYSNSGGTPVGFNDLIYVLNGYGKGSPVVAIPEPASPGLLGISISGLLAFRCRRIA
ncbi:MAG TPA: PEP-CTERM sorting domain-containing protein, partial [Tepidisphaeraceae bacterium]|nr:PEP-CTERM sorting domain-containing protein [Tepidisphaeraceae bacterium]